MPVRSNTFPQSSVHPYLRVFFRVDKNPLIKNRADETREIFCQRQNVLLWRIPFFVLQYRQRIHLHKERAIPKFGCCKKEKYRHRMYPHTRNFGLGTDTILIRTKVRQRASSVPPNSLASLTFHEKANLVSFRKCIEMRMPVSFFSPFLGIFQRATVFP